MTQAEPGDAVVRVRNDAARAREFAHHQPLGREVSAETGANFGLRVGMQFERSSGCVRRALPGVIVGRGADAAEAEYHIVGGQRAPERRRDQLRLIRKILAPGEFEPA